MKHLLYETPALWLDENQPGVQTQRFKTAAEFAIPMIKHVYQVEIGATGNPGMGGG